MHALKGHGTHNDFVLLPDLDGALTLTPELVRALCDRHAGIGADGVLRIVRTENEPEATDMAADAAFFMDYRNADGSLAEMCGNGMRVFLRYLQRACLVEQEAAVATRGGIVSVQSTTDGDVSVLMGLPQVLADRPVVTAAFCQPGTGSPRRALAAIRMPNPHVVVELADLVELDALDLTSAPDVTPPLPDGQNVEFVVRRGRRHLQMRVHERGSGETRSCGTGICAAVVAIGSSEGRADGRPDGRDEGAMAQDGTWRVDVAGGTCQVALLADGTVVLTGPAVIVAELEVDEAWLAAQGAQ